MAKERKLNMFYVLVNWEVVAECCGTDNAIRCAYFFRNNKDVCVVSGATGEVIGEFGTSIKEDYKNRIREYNEDYTFQEDDDLDIE